MIKSATQKNIYLRNDEEKKGGVSYSNEED